MSSRSFRRPDFRLHLSYPEVTLLRSDVPGMVRLAAPDHPGFADDLRRLAGAVDAAHGRLTVILPDREVWRDRRRLAARLPWARRREARELASRALHVPAGEVALSMGRRGGDGSTPLAATRRQTLVEVRRMLAAVGLRPEVIRGAGRFDGFSTPPALGRLRWVPADPGLPGRLPQAALAAGGLAAAIAVVVAILAAQRPEPVTSPGPLVHRSVARAPVALAEASPLAPAAIPQAVAAAAPPPARPEAASPALAAPAAVPFSVNTRNVDLATAADGRAVLKLRELPGARSPVAAGPAPLPRPEVAREAVAVPQALGAARPRARPVSQPVAAAEPVATVVRRVAVADTEDFGRPEHRPGAPAVRVAALTPADAVVGALAATTIAPLARPDRLQAAAPAEPARPATKPEAAPARKAALPASKPKLQRGATAGAIAARPLAPTIAAPVSKPVAVAALPLQPKIVPITPRLARTAAAAKAAPAAKTATVAKTVPLAAAPAKSAASARQLSLIGVFGSTGAPHALVRLPNGDIERVRAGDRIAGLQVAAVAADGVRVRSGTSETTLRLPD